MQRSIGLSWIFEPTGACPYLDICEVFKAIRRVERNLQREIYELVRGPDYDDLFYNGRLALLEDQQASDYTDDTVLGDELLFYQVASEDGCGNQAY